jgi:O-succinylbenzoate synthase
MAVALESILATAKVVSIGMRTRFRGVSTREALLFEGPNGWAEWSPFTEYADEEAAVWLAAAIEFAFGAEPALVRTEIGINATLPAVSPAEVAGALEPFGKFRTVKIKVAEPGQSIEDDLARVAEVRRLYPDARIRLDANGGYEVEQAVTLGNALAESGAPIDYLEQPVKTIGELAEVRLKLKHLGILVAADESVRKVSDPLAVAHAGAADILVIKAAPLGGISRALSVIREAALPAVISSGLETSVGISMGLHLAGALPRLEHDCGLGTVALLVDDVCDEPLIPVAGMLPVKRVVPSAAKLDSLAASAERTKWWLERLVRCHKLL